MEQPADGTATVYCDGAFHTTNGKTAHGLVRFTRRYRVMSVIDSTLAGRDAGEVLDGKPAAIPFAATLEEAIDEAHRCGIPLTHFVVGLAPDGGRLSAEARAVILRAIEAGLHVDSGLHDFLSEDAQLARAAQRRGVVIRDIRRPPPRSELHFFTGKIRDVNALRLAILGTDSAVGKRTTAWKIVDAFRIAGYTSELVGTGQTAWMQGARYALVLDSLVNDFVSGEIEHAVWRAWHEGGARVIVVEGQGSLLHPAYPGGFEILAAARPHAVILQHAPARKTYDGFPDFPMHPLRKQIEAVELIGGCPVAAITINHEGMTRDEARRACSAIGDETGLPVCDALLDGAEELAAALVRRFAEILPRPTEPAR